MISCLVLLLSLPSTRVLSDNGKFAAELRSHDPAAKSTLTVFALSDPPSPLWSGLISWPGESARLFLTDDGSHVACVRSRFAGDEPVVSVVSASDVRDFLGHRFHFLDTGD